VDVDYWVVVVDLFGVLVYGELMVFSWFVVDVEFVLMLFDKVVLVW